MTNKSTGRLLLVASIFLLPISSQAFDLGTVSSTVNKVQAVNTASDTLSKLNVNTADLAQLSSLSGIGGSTASSIIDYRDTFGAFTNLQDLVNVDGISASTLQMILPYLSL